MIDEEKTEIKDDRKIDNHVVFVGPKPFNKDSDTLFLEV
jgi:hypothetical protein